MVQKKGEEGRNKKLLGCLSIALLFVTQEALAKKKHEQQKKDYLTLRVVSKNMLFGVDGGAALTSDEGFDPTLPAYIDTVTASYRRCGVTELDVARSFENIWQQANNESLLGTRSRLDAMAIELAAQDADVICLQEAALITNNPLVNPDGTERIRPYQIGNGYYGNENSPEFARTFNFAQMLADRLKNNHDQEFDIVNHIIMDGAQAKRTLDTLEESEALLSIYTTTATLVRKSLKAKQLRTYQKAYTYSRENKPGLVILGSDIDGEETLEVNLDYVLRRGYLANDVEICGQPVRILNTHLASTNNFVDFDVVDGNTKFANSPATRAAQTLELLHQEVLPSPYPVILAGDLNVQSVDSPGSKDAFEVGAYQTLVGSILPDGTPTNTGGPLVDACQVLHSGECDTPRYNSSALRNLNAPPFNDFRALRDPNGPWTIRIDYVLFRDGDGIKVNESDVTQVEPLMQSPTQQWAWTSDHRGVVAELKIPRKKC